METKRFKVGDQIGHPQSKYLREIKRVYYASYIWCYADNPHEEFDSEDSGDPSFLEWELVSSKEGREARERLNAAAPDLLAALQKIHENVTEGWIRKYTSEAIEAATGKKLAR